MRKPNLVQRYLSEIIDYGGEPYTRGAVILDMQRKGIDQGCIDRWFQGYELGQELQEKRRLKEETASKSKYL